MEETPDSLAPPLLLLLSLNSWRKCLIKIFVLLCLSEMTYDSSLSQTWNCHSICHHHPTTDSYSPQKTERLGQEMRDMEASRHWTPGRVGLRKQEESWWKKSGCPSEAAIVLSSARGSATHQSSSCSGLWLCRASGTSSAKLYSLI